jgi:hypothetical protein
VCALLSHFALQLAGAKKVQEVQEVLSRPGILEHFLAPLEGADAVHDTWVSMWSLDRDDGKGVEEAVCHMHDLMLKLQRKGGGNNIYQGNISRGQLWRTPCSGCSYI